MDKALKLGSDRGLHFSLIWDEESQATAADATRGTLTAYIGDSLVWGESHTNGDSGIIWTWIELLEYLSRNWLRLEYEETDPLGSNAAPQHLRFEAEKRWEETPHDILDKEENALWQFEEAHNLSKALQGIWPKDLWLLREGNVFEVATFDARIIQPADEILSILEQLGNEIVKRLEQVSDERSTKALSQWRNRKKAEATNLLILTTSLSKDVLQEIAQNSIGESWELSKDFQVNELMVATRMAGPILPPTDLRSLLGHIRKLVPKEIRHFGAWSQEIGFTEGGGLFDRKNISNQGYALARKFRDILKNSEGPINPGDLLRASGILLKEISLSSPKLDAISCWGPKHGAAIFLNRNGKHNATESGKRASLAHEICHLLFDRETSLPFVEVLGGRVPRYLEMRANSFAAEFLIPRDIAGNAFLESKNLQTTLNYLCKKFHASKEIVAWQTYNSGLSHNRQTLQFLQQFVSRPQFFLLTQT